MEQYIIQENRKMNIVMGYYSNIVYKKKLNEFGEDGAKKIISNSTSIFCDSMSYLSGKNRNILLVGKVQSGKTANLEMLTAIAFDNGYNLVVMYGGYDTKLLTQTVNRFKKTFDINEDDLNEKNPVLLSTLISSNIEGFDQTLLDTLIESKKPLIIITMKRVGSLSKVNDLFTRLNISKFKAFIIDDEGDQASLSTGIRRTNIKNSPTYLCITNMKKKLNNPIYFSVTATPQANVLLGDYSELKPGLLRLIEPGKGYTGLASFHSDEEKICIIDEEDTDILQDNSIPESLKNAIFHFIISSSVMKLMGIQHSEMIIHTSRLNDDHKGIYMLITNVIDSYKSNIGINSTDLDIQMNEIMSIYNSQFFVNEIIERYPSQIVKTILSDILKNTFIILQNSKGEVSQAYDSLKLHKIFIGGDLLQRGLTFNHLVTTYFTRWPKQSNMDTVTQRARWLGYRSKFFHLCRIFTTQKIMMEFSNLAETENDLWEQFYSIQNAEISIDDVVIKADKTILAPTRPGVTLYDEVSFTRKWYNQRIGIFDYKINFTNNDIINEVIKKLFFEPSTIGRTDGRISSLFCEIEINMFEKLLNETQGIFENDPIHKDFIKRYISDTKIILIMMFGPDVQQKEYRERTFDAECKISALQQGADTNIIENQHYMGDSKIIIDRDAVNIQLFKVRPKIKGVVCSEFDQFMFSIYLPNQSRVYKKSEV